MARQGRNTLMDTDLPLFRATDPETSRKGAKDVLFRRNSQLAKLLDTYWRHASLTNYEAGQISGLATKPGCCYWKRCSELLHMGLIAPTGETRLMPTGSEQAVHKITPQGIETFNKVFGVTQ